MAGSLVGILLALTTMMTPDPGSVASTAVKLGSDLKEATSCGGRRSRPSISPLRSETTRDWSSAMVRNTSLSRYAGPSWLVPGRGHA
jgi:hypothetical protein